MARLCNIWGARALHAALLIFPLWLSGCNDNSPSPLPADGGANPLDLVVSITGSGLVTSNPAGIDCGSDCAESLAFGSNVTLSATTSNGFTFSGWGGDCSGNASSCDLTMSAKRTVTATFTAIPTPTPSPTPTPAPTQFPLSVSVVGTGTVTSTPSGINCGSDCSENYSPGTSVTLNAAPGPGYRFFGWGGACSGTGACTVSMSSAKNLTAEFTLIPTSGNAITLSLVPARTSGVAPLSVFFDASGTLDPSVTTRPFHDLEYRWNFGDPAGGAAWAYGAQPGVSSKNLATGPVAAHVFEAPGTYTVTLTGFDGTNAATTTTTITVQNPDTVFADANTVCFSTSANYTDCPAGSRQVKTDDFAAAINGYKGPNRRLLFRRGETFNAASSGVLDVTGPGIIGAFGAGTALPIAKITAGGAFPIIQLSGPYTPGIGDWRIIDFDIDGSFVQSSDVSGIGANGGFNQFLALRLNIHDIYRGIAAGPDILDWWNNHDHPGHTIFDEWSVVDSTMNGIPGCNSPGNYNCDWRVYLAAKHSTVQGNYLDNQGTDVVVNGVHVITAGGSHVLRSEYTGKGVFSNNTLARAGDFQLAIKLHAKNWTTPGVTNPGGVGTYTEQVVIADNKIIGGINPWTLSLGPQDEINDERVRDIIVERNWFTAGGASQVHMHINSFETTIRNNICDLSGAAYHTCVLVDQWGITPAPDNVRVYSNTFYSGTSDLHDDFVGVEIGRATNTTVENNLGSAPLASGPAMISGAGTGLVQSNNLLNNSPAALFVSTAPTAPANFSLKALPNPARDTGLSTLPVFSDFFGTGRPKNGVTDIGAVEGAP